MEDRDQIFLYINSLFTALALSHTLNVLFILPENHLFEKFICFALRKRGDQPFVVD